MTNYFNQIENFLCDKIINQSSIGGGCIANSIFIETNSGKKYFLKSYGTAGKLILQNETNGLKELSKASVIRIPEVILQTDSFLLLEFIKEGNRSVTFSEKFGRQFASLHRYTGKEFGFYENNFIGSNPQKNLPQNENWVEFYWNNRLLYQYKLAETNGYVSSELKKGFGKIEKLLPEIISGSLEPPSLLHGDLWSGNYMVDENGSPCLIDPAVYYGHREADLAMTHLFGGFDSYFYESYDEAFPLPEGHQYRLGVYKLYHLLNHLNLFGSGYYQQVISTIEYYL